MNNFFLKESAHDCHSRMVTRQIHAGTGLWGIHVPNQGWILRGNDVRGRASVQVLNLFGFLPCNS